MQFDVYRVPFSSYPRCQYAYKHLKQLSDRYEYLTGERLPKEYNPVSTDTSGRINNNKPEFHLCLQNLKTSDKGGTLEIKDVLKRNEGSRFIETVKWEKVGDLVYSKAYLKEKYLILITKESINRDDVPQCNNVQTIVVTEDIKDGDKALECRKVSQNLHLSLKGHISDQVSNLMEQNIFKAFKMRIKCEHLQKILNSIPKVDARQEKSKFVNVGEQEQKSQIKNKCQVVFNTNKNGTQKSNSDSSQRKSKSAGYNSPRADVSVRGTSTKRAMSAQDRRLDDYIAEMSKLDLLQGRSTTDEISSKPEEEHTVKKKPRTDINISPVIENYQEHMERIERLYDEINGMFARSRVPKEEQPQCDRQFDGTINDKLKEELRQLSSSIRSCGYRFRSVLVFVDDNCDQEMLKPDIERILKTYNISTFTIVSSSVKELSSCNVGSEVAAVFDDSTVKYGTLGGFGHTSSDEGNNTICLVSRHVVTDTYGNPASTLKVSKGKNTTKASIIVDKSISSKRNPVLDIAAASFENGDSQFDTMYKTSEEKAAKGRLSEYRLEELKGLPVHICGSKTPMGYGTITVPKVEAVQDSSMNDFIIIEDRDNPRQEKIPFCAKGDSGSIVCADDQENPDNVQLISMVIGEDLWNTGFYHSLNLEEGIKQLKEETKSNIQLL